MCTITEKQWIMLGMLNLVHISSTIQFTKQVTLQSVSLSKRASTNTVATPQHDARQKVTTLSKVNILIIKGSGECLIE